MRLLVLLVEYSYNINIIEKKSKERFRRLADTKMTPLEVSENVQVVPYEVIWARIIEKLKTDVVKIGRLNSRIRNQKKST